MDSLVFLLGVSDKSKARGFSSFLYSGTDTTADYELFGFRSKNI